MQEGFKSLVVWQKAMVHAEDLYRLADMLPNREQHGLAGQMRRSAVSVPSNIAEGSRRSGKKDFAHFVSIAHGSLAELETQILIAENCYKKISFDAPKSQIEEISRMLLVLGRRLRSYGISRFQTTNYKLPPTNCSQFAFWAVFLYIGSDPSRVFFF